MPQVLADRRRLAGHGEHRCIIRQYLGYQRTLSIAAVYAVAPDSQLAQPNKRAFVPALKHCIARHPILSTVILGSETESPEFVTPSFLDLANHIQFLSIEDDQDEQFVIKQALTQTSDEILEAVDETPPWKIVITSLPSSKSARLLVTFAFFHSHGDGKSGLAFHKTFLEGLNASEPTEDSGLRYEPSTGQLPPPLEKVSNLSISWSFLLGPLLGAYLPTFLGRALGFQASTASQDQSIWRGGEATFPTNPQDFRTGLELLVLEEGHIRAILDRCRTNGATFTGLLHQLIVRALSEVLPDAGVFSADTVVDLRQHTNGAITDNDMGNWVSADNEIFKRSEANQWQDWTTNESAPAWEVARQTSEKLRKRASTTHDQPIGLLKYLNDFRTWMTGKIGKDRESSYEISNLVLFAPPAPRSINGSNGAAIEQVIFAQPANAVGNALNFNAVSTKGGPFVLTITWQRETLGLVRDESEFVADIRQHIVTYLMALATVDP